MRRTMIRIGIWLPLAGWSLGVGCGVTDRQFSDFAVSTGIQVFVQSVVSLIGAAILQNYGTV